MKTTITLMLLFSALALVTGQHDGLQEDSVFMELWDEHQETWFLLGKGENLYDENGLLATSIFYMPDEEDNLIPLEKTEYEYDNNGNRIRETEYGDEGGVGVWIAYEKREYALDASRRDTLMLAYEWDHGSQKWQPEGKIEFTNDASGNLVQEIKYRTEDAGKTWIPQWKFEYEYDSAGNEILQTSYSWDDGGKKWDPSEKIAQTFDENGNVVTHYHEYWDMGSGQWKFQDKEKYEIVSTDSTKQVTTLDWDESTSQWVPSIRMTHYYSDPGLTGINVPGTADLVLFPNPATEFIMFSRLGKNVPVLVEIIDIQGSTVLKQEVDRDQKVYVEHLNEGLYIYRIFTEDRSYTGKLIIK